MLENLIDSLFFNPSAPMIFTHQSFWIFLLAIFFVYGLIHKKTNLRTVFLFVVSIYFYYKCGGHYFFLLLFSVFFNYAIALWIDKTTTAKRKFALFSGVFVNLFLISYFKYAYLFVGYLNQVFDTNFQVKDIFSELVNSISGSNFDVSSIILPVGISFFTFQAISYLVDVYRKQIPALKNPIDFGFYLAFFPGLVAGPIVRATDFIPQIHRPYQLSRSEFAQGLFLVFSGLIKKCVISDYISLNFVDRVFDNPELYSGFENLMAYYGYAMQIYCDFSGYTDIAIGVALWLGFRLPPNFNSPYKAQNITDFWRRWHISLSSWLKDYLYISLGGNRKGKIRTYFNLFLTMLLGGLWHGAATRFILWGALHGLALIVHKLYLKIFPKNSPNKLSKLFSALLTFHFVAFCWIFFRAENMDIALQMLARIFSFTEPELILEILAAYKNVFLLILFGYIIHCLPHNFKESLKAKFTSFSLPILLLVSLILFFFVYQMQSAEIQPFIYFQF